MCKDQLGRLESWVGVDTITGIASETRQYLSSRSGLNLAGRLSAHLSAYNATDDLVPYFGDYRLAHTEAFYQLKNSICLAYYGFYSQAFATLRSVFELSLLQASLPQGDVVSDRTLGLLSSMLPRGQALPTCDEVNWVLPAGFGATQAPDREATSLSEWALDGCRTPPWHRMLERLLESDIAREFDTEVQLSARVRDLLSDLDPYVHARGRLRSATGLSNGNMLRFSKESMSKFGERMTRTTLVSITVLLLAFLPTATSHPEAAAGFIDYGDLQLTLSVLPSRDADLLRAFYKGRD